MTDAILLKIALVRSGMTVLELCEKCGFSAAYYYKCLKNKQDFRTAEVKAICDALHIGTEEMATIFFAADVAKKAQKEESP